MKYNRCSTAQLIRLRSSLMRRYHRLPRKDSFSGWHFAGRIETIDSVLSRLNWKQAAKNGDHAG